MSIDTKINNIFYPWSMCVTLNSKINMKKEDIFVETVLNNYVLIFNGYAHWLKHYWYNTTLAIPKIVELIQSNI